MAKLVTPDFKAPPINEVVFGVTFKDSPIQAVDLGLFYSTIKDTFQSSTDHPPVLQQAPGAPLNVLLPRVWFEGEDKSRLVQLQQDRFFYNWRDTPPGKNVYPHFSTVFSEFVSSFDTLKNWWIGNFGKNTEIKSFELTYINHIDLNSGWCGPSDNHKVFNFLDCSKLVTKYEQTESLFRAIFYQTEIDSDITISIKHGQRLTDGLPVAIYEITVRERTRGVQNILEWFALAHNSINDIFVDTITNDAKKKWGYTK